MPRQPKPRPTYQAKPIKSHLQQNEFGEIVEMNENNYNIKLPRQYRAVQIISKELKSIPLFWLIWGCDIWIDDIPLLKSAFFVLASIVIILALVVK